MSDESAEQAVTATTDSYGGPASEEQLAEVYLPDGQDEVRDTGSEGETAQPESGGRRSAGPDTDGTASTPEPPD